MLYSCRLLSFTPTFLIGLCKTFIMLKYLEQSRCRSLLVLWENIYTNVDVNSKPMRSRSFWAHSLHYKCYNEPVKGEMISDGWTFPCPLVGRGRSSRCNQLNCGSQRERENTQTEGHRTGERGQRERDSFNAPLQSNKPPPPPFSPSSPQQQCERFPHSVLTHTLNSNSAHRRCWASSSTWPAGQTGGSRTTPLCLHPEDGRSPPGRRRTSGPRVCTWEKQHRQSLKCWILLGIQWCVRGTDIRRPLKPPAEKLCLRKQQKYKLKTKNYWKITTNMN